MESMIFKVRPTKEAEFAKLVKKFNRCLKSSGMDELYPLLIGECDIDIKVGSSNLHYSVKGNEYHLQFPDGLLSMKGHRFIGEYRKIDGKWHRTMQSNDLIDELEVNEGNLRCDHCGKDIKNRNGYFFFRDADNNLKVVGSTCVDAYIGMDVSQLLSALGDATEFERSAGSADLDREIIGIGIESFMALVNEATDGFSKWRKSSDPDATSSKLKKTIMDVFMGRQGVSVPNMDNADEIVEKCRQYWNGVYVYDDLSVNSRKSLEGDYVPMRWAGIAGWAAYKAVCESSKPTLPKTDGRAVGCVGDSMTMPLTPTSHASFNSKWGNKLAYVVNFDDADGNHYKTFTTSKHFMDKVRSSVGKPMLVGFTIAGYETSRGRNINRIKCAKCA